MKNSDFIQMTQCHLHSMTFPVDNLQEVLENAIFSDEKSKKVELVKNPITGKKVHQLENGLFFTLRTTFKKVTKALLSAKVYELKQQAKQGKLATVPDTENGWDEIARVTLFQAVPFSSEMVNVFYYPEQSLLITNNGSAHSKYALLELVNLFKLVGVKSIVVSNEKLGLDAKLETYLNHHQPLFKYLSFQNEATLRRMEDGDEAFLMCRHLDTATGRAKALNALNEGYSVQSMAMCVDDEFGLNFKLDHHLKLRSLRFKDYADVAKRLNNPNTVGKATIFEGYLQDQLDVLLKIARCTVLEFTAETELENFV